MATTDSKLEHGDVEVELVGKLSPPSPPDTRTPDGPPSQPGQLSGWRLRTVLAASLVGLFLSLLDTTIVAVSLTTIASQFEEFDHATWVINAYMLAYMSFAIIISRLSDPFGQKAVEVASFAVFLAFSIGCALSKSMTQLIIFRALQGIGGSGLYSMAMVITITQINGPGRAMIGAYISICVTTAGVLGPILGGAITHGKNSHTWPWIFWINLPIAGSSLAAILIAWPEDKTKRLTRKAIASVDFLGSLLLLAASCLLVFALEEAGSLAYAWRSATIVASLVVSGVSLVTFILWQQWITMHSSWAVKVVFPISLMTRRVLLSATIAMFVSGFVYYIAVVNLPTRFQIASGDSPIIAGVRLLPMLFCAGAGAMIGGAISRKRNNTAYVLVVAWVFQLLGYGLMTTLGHDAVVPARQYGFQVLIGLGFGLSMTSATYMTTLQLQKEPQWIPVTQGALAQIRVLGGAVGLAIAVAIFSDKVKRSTALSAALTPSQASSLYRSPLIVETFPQAQRELVAQVFAEAFTQQMYVAMYLAAAGFVASLFTLERNPPKDMMRGPPKPSERGSNGEG